MQCVFIHGMGPGPSSWDGVIANIQEVMPLDAVVINLWQLLDGKKITYDNLHTAFSEHLMSLDNVKPPFNLCGLSLGGRLTLNYAADFPQNVASIMAIGTHYKTPPSQVRIQKWLFRLTPASAFANLGLPKKDMMSLCASLAEVDLSQKVKKISCTASILYGEKDSKLIKEAANYFVENIPNAKLGSVANAGHQVNIENPVELAQKIIEFFGTNR